MYTESTDIAIKQSSIHPPGLLRILSFLEALVVLVFAVGIAWLEIFFLMDHLTGVKHAPSLYRMVPLLLFAVMLFFFAYGLYRLKKWALYLHAFLFAVVLVPLTALSSYALLWGGAFLATVFLTLFSIAPPFIIGGYFWTQRRWFH
ncbi:MAG: hypothetical protein WDZ44_01405 [Candidatus Spechtbacterales bacterium]